MRCDGYKLVFSVMCLAKVRGARICMIGMDCAMRRLSDGAGVAINTAVIMLGSGQIDGGRGTGSQSPNLGPNAVVPYPGVPPLSELRRNRLLGPCLVVLRGL